MIEVKSRKNSKLVGLVTTLFSEQMLKHSYNVMNIGDNNYKNVVNFNKIETVFIDNDIYERDHDWYEKPFEDFIEYLHSNEMEIFVIRNTENKIQECLKGEFIIEIDNEIDDIIYNNNKIKTPLLFNEYIFNPGNHKKNNDVIYYSIEQKSKRPPHVKLFNREHSPVYTELFTEGISRRSLEELIDRVKHSKIIYVYYSNDLDITLLNYISRAAILYNTYVVLDAQFDVSIEYTFNSKSDSDNVGQMRVIKNSELFKDKQVLKLQRKLFLENTFLTINTLDKMLETEETYRRAPEISVITSTNRVENLPHYIKQMNEQKHINLQVVLLTHGFELDEKQEESLLKNASFEYKLLNESSNFSLGICLNKCINHANYSVITKVDDDDFYLDNYLIDQWIALKYSKADVVGKAAQFIYIEKENMLVGRNLDRRFQHDRFVMGATLMGSSNIVKSFMFSDLPKAVDTDFLNRVRKANGLIYQNSPYDFCIFRAENKDAHTWQVDDLVMVKAGQILSYGDPKAYISTN